ncbi:ParA family protein [Deinococcus ficus]|uniref:ParA family protein n=1 Tax=Deinococcus ficus TaxID=317577 RepID=UPI0003B7A0FF|nr:ParA family protein [Deinococcus ficus]
MTRRTPRTLGVVNQKGGVGKTTTAVNLAAYLAAEGQRVLLIDMDPQGNATSGLGAREAETGLYEALGEPARAAEYTRPSTQEGLDVLPATPDLAGAGVELADDPDALTRLLASIQGYDMIIVDAPPSLGPLTVNVLAAVDALVIPLQAEYYALEGLAGLMGTVERVQGGLNPRLKVLGIVLTMFDGRTNLAQEVETMVRGHFGELVFWAVVPRNVRLSEAPSFSKPINLFAPLSSGAAAYKRLADEVMQRVEKI